ncbi:MAG: cytochrome P460 family protein [Pseudomonadota bacterium]|nr:cytochrome P460 family protein [Pseudomonadota bacterium]
MPKLNDHRFAIGLIAVLCMVSASVYATPKPAPNGITLPDDYRRWDVIAVSQRRDNQTLRVILGNPAAMAAVRQGQHQPWPDGSILAKVVWTQAQHEIWPDASVPGEFVHVELMVKDREQYRATGGWGFARWQGDELKAYGASTNFSRECFSCHQPVADQDYVFTVPAAWPK